MVYSSPPKTFALSRRLAESAKRAQIHEETKHVTEEIDPMRNEPVELWKWGADHMAGQGVEELEKSDGCACSRFRGISYDFVCAGFDTARSSAGINCTSNLIVGSVLRDDTVRQLFKMRRRSCCMQSVKYMLAPEAGTFVVHELKVGIK